MRLGWESALGYRNGGGGVALGRWQETEARALGARKAKRLGLGRGRVGSRLGLSGPQDSACMRVNGREASALCKGFTGRVGASGWPAEAGVSEPRGSPPPSAEF